MEVTKQYVDFILDYLGTSIKVQLPEPQDDGRYINWKLGPRVIIPVQIEVLATYTRSANLFITFDKYSVEKLFFMPLDSSPNSIVNKIGDQIRKIVIKSYLEDGRKDEIKQMYDAKREEMGVLFVKVAGKISEIESNNSNKIIE